MTKIEKKIITFYSYKGGVGRSKALANIAWLLVKEHNKNVIIVDWDLEAPGLHKFFDLDDKKIKQGLIDLFLKFKDVLSDKIDEEIDNYIDITEYLTEIKIEDNERGSLKILPAGKFDNEYSKRVNSFSWDDLYKNWNGYGIIEFIKNKLYDLADYVLIDSRTGITDIGGICTRQLPDLVVLCFVYNDQNLNGIKRIAESISKKEEGLKQPDLLFLPSRVEISEELNDRVIWEEKSMEKLIDFIPKKYQNIQKNPFIDDKIPYFPKFSFGEIIAVKEFPDYEISKEYKNILKLIIEKLNYKTKNVPLWVLNEIEKVQKEKSDTLHLTEIQLQDENRLTELPESLNEFNLLRKLRIKGADLKNAELNFYYLNDIEELHLTNCELFKIPDLSQLKNLRKLDLSNNKISEIKGLERLFQLQEVNLKFNKIKKIEGLDHLGNLKKIDISHNQVIKIEGLEKLNSLKELYLNSNQISKIEGLEKLSPLKTLHLQFNQINKIEGLEKLNFLKKVSISSNRISKIEGLEKLSLLEQLYLYSNQINKIEGLEKLSLLEVLYLDSNQIGKIEGLEKLSLLKKVSLSSNQISKIEGLKQLRGLSFLNLQKNEIKDLINAFEYFKTSPLEIVWEEKIFRDAEGTNLYNNPIQNPPIEIVKQGKQAVIDWVATNKKSLSEIKVILIGEPKAGKTSILRRLKQNAFNPEERQTDGINIETIVFSENAHFKNQLSLQGITAYFWDFGGQEIMSAIHQFFLTKRAIYVLVLDARMDKDSSANIRKWIQQIEVTGGKASIIIVANQIDVNSGFGFKNESDLAEEFPQIKYFLKTSCTDGWEASIEALKDALADLIPKADLFNTEIDARWFPIKEQLQKETKAKNYIDESAFVQICTQHGLTNRHEQESLIRFLQDLGIVSNFDKVLDKANDNLKEYFVLDPYWITYGVYQILTSTYAAQQKGIVAMDKLEYMINEEADKLGAYNAEQSKKLQYSTYQRKFLLEILREFKLCFVKGSFARDDCHFIIPDLLATKEPKTETGIFKEHPDKLSFIYAYEFLPKSVLPHIMVETDKYLSTYWRSGCLIAGNDCKALIKDYSNKITIEVIGDAIKKKDVLAVIRDLVESINSEQGLNAKRLIPLPKTEETVNYDELVERFKDGKTEYEIYNPKRFKKTYLISELLDGIPASNRMNDHKLFKDKPKLFVSYSGSSEDVEHLDDFNTRFRNLERNGLIEKWTDLQIKPGQVRGEVLMQELETADVVVFLVSPDSIASDYIQEVQTTKAIERHKKGDAIIVPIILRPCAFSDLAISKFEALPKAAKPISTWNDKDEAWLDVLQGIKTLIAGIKDKRYNLPDRLEQVLG